MEIQLGTNPISKYASPSTYPIYVGPWQKEWDRMVLPNLSNILRLRQLRDLIPMIFHNSGSLQLPILKGSTLSEKLEKNQLPQMSLVKNHLPFFSHGNWPILSWGLDLGTPAFLVSGSGPLTVGVLMGPQRVQSVRNRHPSSATQQIPRKKPNRKSVHNWLGG